jgi:tetratricopeptide (TPR) repeat protein
MIDGILEREAELAKLRGAIEAAREGRGSIVVLAGALGAGKSTLLGAAGDLARGDGVEVLSAAGRELESDYDFGVALQLFEARLAGAEPAERERLLSGAAGLATELLAARGEEALPREATFSMLHGLYWLCANLAAAGPQLLLIDDAHWADEPSMRFLLYLAQRIEKLPLALILASHSVYRSRGPEALMQIAEHPRAVTTTLDPLSRAGVKSWLQRNLTAAAASSSFSEARFEATRGNPFLLRELALELQQAGPPEPAVSELAPEAIGGATAALLRRIGPGATRLALALAVAGDGAELRHVANAADLEPGEAARVADELAYAGVVRCSGRLALEHPIVRRALYARMPVSERGEIHMKLADALYREGASAERVAAHLLACTHGGQDWVVEALRAAGERAMGRGAPDAAVHFLRRALEEPPSPESRPRVMLELGRAEAMAGDTEAVGRLSSAAELIEDPRQRALTSLDIGRALYAQGRHADAAEAFRNGAAEAGDADSELRLQLQAAHALVARAAGLPEQELDRSAIEREGGATPSGRILLAYTALEAAVRGGSRKKVVELAREALGRGSLLDDETSDGLGPYFAAAALIIAEDLQAAEIALTMAVEDARKRGSVLGFATASYYRSWAILTRGRIDDAAADAQNALAGQFYGWRVGLPGARAVLASCLAERGDRDAASREIGRGAKEAAEGVETPLPLLLFSKARLLLREGRHRARWRPFSSAAGGSTRPA